MKISLRISFLRTEVMKTIAKRMRAGHMDA
jgi:hypothetical protein